MAASGEDRGGGGGLAGEAAALRQAGNEHFQAGRYEEALEAYASALSLDPPQADLSIP